MIRVSRFVILAVFGILMACSGKKNAQPVSFDFPRVVIKAGGNGVQRLKINVASPYHFNKDFPSRLTIIEPDGLEFRKKEFGSDLFHASAGGAVVDIRFRVPADVSGGKKIEAKVDCSVCRDDECRVFRGLKVEIPVEISKPGDK